MGAQPQGPSGIGEIFDVEDVVGAYVAFERRGVSWGKGEGEKEGGGHTGHNFR